MSKKINALWREIVKEFEITGELEEGGVKMARKSPDPSLARQLHDRYFLVKPERMQAYLDACTKAPNASSGTKRKWRRLLELDW